MLERFSGWSLKGDRRRIYVDTRVYMRRCRHLSPRVPDIGDWRFKPMDRSMWPLLVFGPLDEELSFAEDGMPDPALFTLSVIYRPAGQNDGEARRFASEEVGASSGERRAMVRNRDESECFGSMSQGHSSLRFQLVASGG